MCVCVRVGVGVGGAVGLFVCRFRLGIFNRVLLYNTIVIVIDQHVCFIKCKKCAKLMISCFVKQSLSQNCVMHLLLHLGHLRFCPK